MAATAPAENAAMDHFDALANAIDADGRWLLGALLVATCLHTAIALALPHHSPSPQTAPASALVVDVETPPPPPERDEPPSPPAAAPPSPETPPKSPKRDTPPPLAQAAKVLSRDEHAGDPADRAEDFVTGDGALYAGGTTSATGTSKRVVHESSGAGTPAGAGQGGVGTAPSNGPDRSRRASMQGGATWQCPFPAEADDVNDASVTLRVELDAAGRVLHALVLRDPGRGFGREATRCVYDKRWIAALDREGSPITATAVVVVRFVR